MYIVIFAGDKKEPLMKIKTLSEILWKVINIVENQGVGETTKTYDSREAFLEVIGEVMQDDHKGYIIGVDVDKNTFEILYVKYDWVYEVVKEETE